MTRNDLSKRLFAEWFGTLALVATVVGSGIMAETLANNNVALALLGNTIATGAILVVLITMLGPVSGAHFNPTVSAAFVLRGALSGRLAMPRSTRRPRRCASWRIAPGNALRCPLLLGSWALVVPKAARHIRLKT